MNEDKNQTAQMDWKDIITEAFFDAWKENSPVDITDYAYKIENAFNVELIVSNLMSREAGAPDPALEAKYHRNRINILARAFVLALLIISDDGKLITIHNIEKAKTVLLRDSPCDYE